MPGTSLAAYICPTTHQMGIFTFFGVKFHKQILTLLEQGLRFTVCTSGNYFIGEALFPGFCNYMHPLNMTHNLTLLTQGMVHISKGDRVTFLEVMIGPFTVDRLKTFLVVSPSANWPAVTILTYVFLQVSVSLLELCSFTICITFQITSVLICIGMPYECQTVQDN